MDLTNHEWGFFEVSRIWGVVEIMLLYRNNGAEIGHIECPGNWVQLH